MWLIWIDAGINDFSWSRLDKSTPFKSEHQSTNLTKLAKSGLVLDNAYTLPICSPSRAAMLTGIYPFKMGLQRGFSQQIPEGIPTDIKLLPEYLKTLGYKTHMFGKWHLGFCNEKYTPVERGFDSFQGHYVASMTGSRQDKLDIFKQHIRKKTSSLRQKKSKKLKARLNKAKNLSKKQKTKKKVLLHENKRNQHHYYSLKTKSENQRRSNKKQVKNYKEMVKDLKQTQRIMYRHLSRKRTRRSVHGYGKRPKDMESKSYMEGVAEILKSHNKDTPFFILLSFFTKSYRY